MTTEDQPSQEGRQNRFMSSGSSDRKSRIYVVDYLGERDCRYHVLDLEHDTERRTLHVFSTDVHVMPEADQGRVLEEAGYQEASFLGGYDWSA